MPDSMSNPSLSSDWLQNNKQNSEKHSIYGVVALMIIHIKCKCNEGTVYKEGELP